MTGAAGWRMRVLAPGLVLTGCAAVLQDGPAMMMGDGSGYRYNSLPCTTPERLPGSNLPTTTRTESFRS